MERTDGSRGEVTAMSVTLAALTGDEDMQASPLSPAEAKTDISWRG